MDRKDFIKKACFAGACFCGASHLSGMTSNISSPTQEIHPQLNQDWLSSLFSNLDQDLEEEVLRKIVKKSSIVHYNQLNLDSKLSEYMGELEKFIDFMERSWGWRIDYDKTTKTVIVDENKDYCVCPVLEHKKGSNSATICYCSEGFAEKMFSVVTGAPVAAKVISSIRKGDKSCKYEIKIS
jgi:predicted hydrocarbon binding protein